MAEFLLQRSAPPLTTALRRSNRVLALILLAGTSGHDASAPRPHAAAAAPRLQPPLSFEANRGQADDRVRFLARGQGYNLFLTAGEAVLTLTPSATSDDRELHHPAAVRMRLIGGDANPIVEGLDELPTRSNYLIGSDPAGWRTNVPHYARVRFRDVYPGVDKVFHAAGGHFEYDFIVSPGAEPSRIRVGFDGVDAMRVNDAQSMVLTIGNGEIEHRAPTVYQDIDGSRRAVAARYLVTGPREIGFEIAAYDRTRPLVIDPVVVYATYLGVGHAVATDNAGSTYVTGSTVSSDLPTVNPVQPGRSGALSDGFLLKIDPTGTRLEYATYFGGSNWDYAYGIAVDASGNAYVTGVTWSADFPTRNALQSAMAGRSDAFVAKFNAAGSAVVYSTYLGGAGVESINAIAVDRAGRAYVTGATSSINFPVVNALQPAKRGNSGSSTDVFIAKLDASGAALVYSTYLGGDGDDTGTGIAIDAGGNAYVAGSVTSQDFPTLHARQPAYGGRGDAFIAKIAPGGTLLYSTYLGGSDRDQATAIAVTAGGRSYVTGSTRSLDFPSVNAHKATNGQSTVYRSIDGGRNWRPLGLNNVGVQSIAVDPVSPSTLYAAAWGDGIFKSTNGGARWTAINIGLRSLYVNVVAVDPFSSNTVYAGGDDLFKSTDGGRSWAMIRFGPVWRHTVFALAFDPVRPHSLYVGNYNPLARTHDGSASWTDAGVERVTAIAVDPLNPSILYAGQGGDDSDDFRGGIFKSTDGGATWVRISRAPIPRFRPKNRDTRVAALVVDSLATSTIYAATEAGLFKSTTGGDDWTLMNTGLPPVRMTSLVIDPLNPATLYLGTWNGIFKTADGGATWTAVNNGLLNLSVAALTVSPTDPRVIYAGTTGDTGDAFLASFSANGASLISSTYLGGEYHDVGTGVALDARGNAYVTGSTASKSFPTVGAFQTTPGGADLWQWDAFVAAFTGAGSRLLYASYIGGSRYDDGSGIAVDPFGNVVVAGSTASEDFPVRRPLQPGGLRSSAFLVKIAVAASAPPDISRSTAGVTAPGVPAASSESARALGVFTTRDGVRYQVETAAADLDSPSALAFAPDGRLFVTERVGRVRIFDAALRSSSVALTLDDVLVQGEAGLLGLALDPDFAQMRLVYLYYTARAGTGAVNRVVRYRELDGRLTEPVVLLDNIPGNTIHNGGRLRFSPDDLLYITTGDAGVPSLAQDLGSLAGKILRLNRDGTTPRGNPFASPIFSSGHRDPQGLDWHPVTGDLWSAEAGFGGNDEINIISAGGNYGWPSVAGHDGFPGMQPPMALFESAIVPSGGSFYDAPRIGGFKNDFFMATLEGNGLLRIRVDGSSPRRIVDHEWLVDGRFGRLRSVITGPDGLLYLVTSNGRTNLGEARDRIMRIVPR